MLQTGPETGCRGQVSFSKDCSCNVKFYTKCIEFRKIKQWEGRKRLNGREVAWEQSIWEGENLIGCLQNFLMFLLVTISQTILRSTKLSQISLCIPCAPYKSSGIYFQLVYLIFIFSRDNMVLYFITSYTINPLCMWSQYSFISIKLYIILTNSTTVVISVPNPYSSKYLIWKENLGHNAWILMSHTILIVEPWSSLNKRFWCLNLYSNRFTLLYLFWATLFSASGVRMSLSNVRTIDAKLGRWLRSFCQQSSISW